METCYFCFRDRKNKEIIWFVPISTKYEKYKKIYENKKLKSGNRPVYNFVFGKVLGKNSVFLIQNIFPTTENYIEKKYTNSNMDVEIPTTERDNVIITSLRVVELAQRGINIPFYNIIEMKNILLKKQNSANDTQIGTENKQSNVSLRPCFAEYKYTGEQMLLANLLATNKCVGEQIKETIPKNRSSFFMQIIERQAIKRAIMQAIKFKVKLFCIYIEKNKYLAKM